MCYRTTDLNAKEGVHYAGKEGKVTFEHGEDVKNIELQIINDHETKKDENCQVVCDLFVKIKREILVKAHENSLYETMQ